MPEPSAEDLKAIAVERRMIDQLLAQGKHLEAALSAEALVKRFPDVDVAWMVLATVHMEDGWAMRRDSRAEEAAERAYELAGPRTPILIALAVTKHRQRRLEECQRYLHQLLEDPGHSLKPTQEAALLHIRATIRYEAECATEADKQKALCAAVFHTAPKVLTDWDRLEVVSVRTRTELAKQPTQQVVGRADFLLRGVRDGEVVTVEADRQSGAVSAAAGRVEAQLR